MREEVFVREEVMCVSEEVYVCVRKCVSERGSMCV